MGAYRIIGPASISGEGWKLNGLEVEFDIEMPAADDTSADANTYRTRNAGKVGRCWWFRGVPFATTRRWKPAVFRPMSGEIDATKWGPVPMQGWAAEGMGERRPKYGTAEANDWDAEGTFEDEFANTLSFWTPVGAATGKPAIFFQPGGGQGVNWAGSRQNWGDVLAYEQGAVVVSTEYRRGPFGRWYTPDIEAEDDWQGPNFALSDIKAGLMWLNTYAPALGIDKITLAGTSAGGENTLAIAEADSFDALYDYRWCSSGGGNAPRMRIGVTPGFNDGYLREFGQMTESLRRAGAYIRDRTDPTRTVADAMAALGDAEGLRVAMQSRDVHAVFGGGKRVRGGQLVDVPHRNYGIMRDGLEITARTATIAARVGFWSAKPTWISVVENEAGGLVDPASLSGGAMRYYLRILGYGTRARWVETSFIDDAWDYEEQNRILHNHAVFHFPAWQQAKALRLAGVPVWLSVDNFTHSGEGRVGHSTDIQKYFGQPQLEVAGDATTANITARGLRMAHAQRRNLARFIRYGNPAPTAGTLPDTFAPFATPLDLTMTAATETDDWNVIGANARVATDALLEIRYEPYFAGAWPAYEALTA